MKPIYNKKQSGVALFVSLIMLLLLTIIGITSMKTTILEEKMAGNMIDRGIAFQAAETAVRAGENYLKSSAVLGVFPTASAGLYLPSNGATQQWESIDWSGTTNYQLDAATLGKVAAQPRYIVEELPAVPEAGSSLEVGVAAESRYYRVTSRGVGGTATAVVMLQTTYKR